MEDAERYIEILKEFEIFPGGLFPSKNNMDLEVVEPVLHWFKDRTRERVYEAVEEMRTNRRLIRTYK